LTNEQLFLSVGIPLLFNGLIFLILNARIGSIEARVDGRMNGLDGRMSNLEHTMTTRFDLLLGKIDDIDTRLARLEERSAR